MEETRRVGFEVKLYEAFYTLFFILNQKLIIFLFSFLFSKVEISPQKIENELKFDFFIIFSRVFLIYEGL